MVPRRRRSDLYQMDPAPNAKNFGNNQYGIHSKRFNYLFHDNHVQALKIEQTVGIGDFGRPKGDVDRQERRLTEFGSTCLSPPPGKTSRPVVMARAAQPVLILGPAGSLRGPGGGVDGTVG